MLRLSRQADYALVLLAHLARQDETEAVRSARDLSEATGLPLPIAGKVLKALAREGLLESRRGLGGGYVLTRPTASISVAEVVRAVDGPIAVTDCSPRADAGCRYESRCVVRVPLRRLDAALRDTLERLTLGELVAPSSSRAAASAAPAKT